MSYKNKFQLNSRLNYEGDYLAGRSFNLPNLRHYAQDRAWDFLKSFDCTIRSIRQNLLNYYKTRLNYVISLPKRIHLITITLIRDNIVLLELTFEYTVCYQPNININDSWITYYTKGENK